MDAAALAERIWHARREGVILPAPSLSGVALDLATAYRVQAAVTEHRLAAGERVVGWKLGYTSQVMRTQMGIDQPNFGPLTNVMALVSGATAPSFLRQPRVEPEVALTVSRPIPPGTAAADLADFVGEARAALEVVDSSWTGYRFDLSDNTADSSSAGAFVLGDSLPLVDPERTEVKLNVTGQESESGTADAAMGNPLNALAWLVANLGAQGETLPAGTVVLTGGLTRAVPLAPGATATALFQADEVQVTVTLHRPGGVA